MGAATDYGDDSQDDRTRRRAGRVDLQLGRRRQARGTYWIGRAHWGKGIASRALREFLELDTTRPLDAAAAADNIGSLRVLEKCGFRVTGPGRGYSNSRGVEVDEVNLTLDF